MEHTGPGCLIMAAGSSTRFGANKLLTPVQGRSMIRRVLDAVPAERFARVTVVTRYPEILQLARDYGFDALENRRPELGASHTVALGTQHMCSCAAICYLVADQPLLRRESIARLLDRWEREPDAIFRAACGTQQGNPCLFPRRFFPELMALTGDRGGSAVLRRHPASVRLVPVDARELYDCDTPQQLQQLLAASSALRGE